MAQTPGKKNHYPPNDGLWWIITILCVLTGAFAWLGVILAILNINGKLPPLNAARRKAIGETMQKGLSAAQEQMRQVTENKATPQRPAPQPARPQRVPEKMTEDKLMSIRGYGKLMTVFGAIASVIFGFSFVATGMTAMSWNDDAFMIGAVSMGFLTLLSILLLGCGVRRIGLARRFGRYLPVLKTGVRDIRELARTVGISRRKVRNDLQRMIDLGWFGSQIYLDRGRGLLMAGETATEPRPRPKPPVQERPAEKPAKPLSREEAILRQIREENVRIQDPAMSEKIDQIAHLTRNIFRYVEEKPEKEGELRRFLSYYLPQTLKLLDAYARMEAQGAAGENIVTAKRQIEELMDKLIEGYRRLLDRLFAGEVLDITSDIAVMKSMLEQDGLAEAFAMPEF